MLKYHMEENLSLNYALELYNTCLQKNSKNI
jgi:hypothetical protein